MQKPAICNSPRSHSERNIVIRNGAGAGGTAAGGCAPAAAGVGCDSSAPRTSTPGASAGAATEHDHTAGADFGSLSLSAVLIVPFAARRACVGVDNLSVCLFPV